MKKSKTKVSTRPLIIDQSHLAWVLSLENWPLLESERERRGALSLFHFHFSTLTFSLSLFFTSTFTILLSLFHFHSFTLNRKLATAREREKGCSFKVGQICSTTMHICCCLQQEQKRGAAQMEPKSLLICQLFLTGPFYNAMYNVQYNVMPIP